LIFVSVATALLLGFWGYVILQATGRKIICGLA